MNDLLPNVIAMGIKFVMLFNVFFQRLKRCVGALLAGKLDVTSQEEQYNFVTTIRLLHAFSSPLIIVKKNSGDLSRSLRDAI